MWCQLVGNEKKITGTFSNSYTRDEWGSSNEKMFKNYRKMHYTRMKKNNKNGPSMTQNERPEWSVQFNETVT